MSALSSKYSIDNVDYEEGVSDLYAKDPASGLALLFCVEVSRLNKDIYSRLNLVFGEPRSVVMRIDTGADGTTFSRKACVDLSLYKEVARGGHCYKAVMLANDEVVIVMKCMVDLIICGKPFFNLEAWCPASHRDEEVMNYYYRKYDNLKMQREHPLASQSVDSNLLSLKGICRQALVCLDESRLYVFRKR